MDFWSDVALQLYRAAGIMLAGTQLITNPEEFEASEQVGPADGPDFVTVTEADADLVGSSTEVAFTTP